MLPSVLVGHFSTEEGADGWTNTGLHAAENMNIATNRKVKDEKYKKKNTKKYGSVKKENYKRRISVSFFLKFLFPAHERVIIKSD